MPDLETGTHLRPTSASIEARSAPTERAADRHYPSAPGSKASVKTTLPDTVSSSVRRRLSG